MIGFLYLLTNTIIGMVENAVDNIKEYNENKSEKRLAYYNKKNGKNHSDTYINLNKGVINRKDLDTNKLVVIDRNKNNDRIVYDVSKGWANKKEIRNIDEIERTKKYNENKKIAFSQGKTVALYMKSYKYDNYMNYTCKKSGKVEYAKGDRFKDINNDKVYVIRGIYVARNNNGNHWCDFDWDKITYFYMDVDTCYLVRRTDEQMLYDNKYADKYNSIKIDDTAAFIEEFNRMQDVIKEQKSFLVYHNTYSSEYFNNQNSNYSSKNKYLCCGANADCLRIDTIINKENTK